MDPLTATLVTTLGPPLLATIFGPAPQPGPSQAQILAMLERQRREEEASRNAWLIGGAIAGAGVLAFLLISRK